MVLRSSSLHLSIIISIQCHNATAFVYFCVAVQMFNAGQSPFILILHCSPQVTDIQDDQLWPDLHGHQPALQYVYGSRKHAAVILASSNLRHPELNQCMNTNILTKCNTNYRDKSILFFGRLQKTWKVVDCIYVKSVNI